MLSIARRIKEWLTTAYTRFKALAEPLPSVTDPVQRDKARFTALLLLTTLVMIAIVFPIRYLLIEVPLVFYLVRLTLLISATTMIFFAYRAARRGNVEFAVLIVGYIGSFLIIITTLVLDAQGTTILNYLVIVVLYMSIFASIRHTIALVIFQLIGIAIVALILPEITISDIIVGPMIFVGAVSTLVVVFTVYRHQLETKRAALLEQNRRNIHATMQGSLDPFYLVEPAYDGNGTITDYIIRDANTPAVKQSGIHRSELIGKGMLEAFPALKSNNIVKIYNQVLTTGQAYEEEFELHLQNRTNEFFYHQVVPFGNGLAITNRDITETRITTIMMEQLNRELISLYETSSALSATLDLDEIYHTIYRELAMRIFQADTFSISDYDIEAHAFTRRYQIGKGEIQPIGETSGEDDPNSNPRKYEAIKKRHPVVFNNLENLDVDALGSGRFLRVKAEIHIPMLINNQPMGIISIYHNDPNRFVNADMSLLVTMGSQAGSAISNARSYQQAQREIAERIKAEEELRRSEEKFRLLGEHSPDTIFIAELPNWNLIYINATEFLGYDLHTLNTGDSIFNQIHEDDKDRVGANWSAFFLNDAPASNEIEYRVKSASGKWEWIQNRAVILQRHDEGSAYRIMVTLTVITERKEAEERLRASEEKFRLLAEYSPDTVYIVTLPELELVYINHDTIVGHSADIMRSDPGLRPFMHPDDAVRMAQHRAQVIKEHRQPFSDVEYRLMNARGEWEWIQSRIVIMQRHPDDTPSLALVTLTVITERKEAEERLRASEARLRSIAEISPDFIYILTIPDLVIEYVNHDNILGHSIETIRERGMGPFIHEDDMQMTLTRRDNLFAGSGDFLEDVEYRMQNADGQWEWVQSRIMIMDTDENGIASRIMAAITVITDRKEAEAQLRENEARFRSMAEISPDFNYVLKWPERIIEYANKDNFLGHPIELIKQQGFRPLTHPDDIENVNKRRDSVASGADDYISALEYRIQNAQGEWEWIYSQIIVMERDDDHKPTRLMGSLSIITERRESEARLRENEERFRSIAEISPDIIYMLDAPDYNVTYINKLEIFGYTVAEIDKVGIRALAHPDDIPVLNKQRDQIKDPTFRGTTEVEYRIKHANGHWLWLQSRIVVMERYTDDTPKRLMVALTIIDERKQAEARLRENEKRFRSIAEISPDIIYIISTPDVKILYINKQSILGHKVDDIEQSSLAPYIHPDDFARLRQNREDVFAGKDQAIEQHLEYRLKNVDGIYEWVQSRAVVMEYHPDGRPSRMMVALTVITDRKEAEERLRENEKRFRLLAEVSPDIIYILTVSDNQLIYINKDTLFGYSIDHIREAGLTHYVSDEHAPLLQKQREELYSGQVTHASKIEYRVMKADGDWEWVQSRAVVMEYHDDMTPSRIMVTLTIITERKNAEKRLRENEERFRTIAEISPDTIYILAVPENKLLYINKDNIVGHNLETIREIGLDPYIHPDDLRRMQEDREQLFEGEISAIEPIHQTEYRLKNSAGSWEWIQSRVVTMESREDGTPSRVMVSLTTITDRKYAEAALRESEERYRAVIASQTEHVNRFLPDFTLTFVNDAYANFQKSTPISLIGTNLRDVINEEGLPEFDAHMEDVMASNAPVTYSIKVLDIDGNSRWFQWTDIAIRDENGKVTEIQGSGFDITERVEAENALRESEERYRAVIGTQTELISRYKPDLTLTFVNETYAKYYNSTIEDLIGTSIQRFLVAEEVEEALAHVQRVLQSHEPLTDIHRTYNSAGEVRWFQWTDIAIRDENGEVTEIQATGIDITERILAEEALIASESHNRAIIRAMPDMIFIFDENGVFLDTFADDTNRLLVPPNEFIGKNIVEIMPQAIAEALMSAIKETQASGDLVTFEYELELRGEPHYYEARLTEYEHGQFLAFIRDITKRINATAALRESEEILHQITENVDNAFFILDATASRVTYVSQGYETIWGVPREPLYEDIRAFQEYIHPDDKERYIQQGKFYANSDKAFNFDYRIIRPDGEVRWVVVRSFAITDQEDNITGYVVIAEDHTERRQYEAQMLEIAREREQQALIQRLINDTTHDLMTPLTIMRTGLDLMRYSQSEDQRLKRIDRLDEQVTHLQEMLEDMFTMFKLDRPVEKNFDFQHIDIVTFLSEIVDDHTPIAKKSDHELVTDLCTNAPIINIDRGKLRRAITNLIDNAIKYTPADTRIVIGSECDDSGTFITIADNGPGIPPEALPHIFERFFRAESHRPSTSGTGLGLAITRRIIEAHGGRIDVDSTLGKGTTFTIWLPKVTT